jgi:hypothetical protein
LPDHADDTHARNDQVVNTDIQGATSGKVTPKPVEFFLRDAGVLATILFDDGIAHSVMLLVVTAD